MVRKRNENHRDGYGAARAHTEEAGTALSEMRRRCPAGENKMTPIERAIIAGLEKRLQEAKWILERSNEESRKRRDVTASRA
jgi:hypothetical protein